MIIPQLLIDKISEPQFTTLIDWQIVDILNTPDPNLPKRKRKVDNRFLVQFMISKGVWSIIAIKANQEPLSDQNIQLKSLCLSVYDSLTIASDTDCSNPETYLSVVNFSNALLAAGIINQSILNDFLDLFEEEQSWVDYHGIPVNTQIIGLARGGI